MAHPALLPSAPALDLDTQIRAAEQAVIDRDNRVRTQVLDLRAGIRARASSGLGRAAMGAVGLAGTVWVTKRLWPRGKTPAAGAVTAAAFDRHVRQAAAKPRMSLTRLIGMVWPLLPIGMRSQIHPGLSGSLLSAFGLGHALAPRLIQQFAQRPPATVSHVDLARFAGRWYEIARLPSAHERKCASDATSTYALDAGGLSVHSRCRRADGRAIGTVGRVEAIGGSGARLRISFAPTWLRWLPLAWTDLWVLDLGAGYAYALLGTPDRQSLWMVARQPDLPGADVTRLADVARAQGYDLSELIATPHTAP